MTTRTAAYIAAACLGVVAGVTVLCSQPPLSWGKYRRGASVAWSPDGTMTATAGGNSGTIHLRDAATGKGRATLRGVTELTNCLTFSPDGSTLASGGWMAIQLWDTATYQLRATLRGHRSGVTTLAFSPDGKTLASADVPTACAKLWDLTTGHERYFEGPHWLDEYDDYVQGMAFSPDGKALAVATWHTVGLWDVATGKNTAVFGRGGKRPLSWSLLYVLEKAVSDPRSSTSCPWSTPRTASSSPAWAAATW